MSRICPRSLPIENVLQLTASLRVICSYVSFVTEARVVLPESLWNKDSEIAAFPSIPVVACSQITDPPHVLCTVCSYLS
jgi:hypothetical protein